MRSILVPVLAVAVTLSGCAQPSSASAPASEAGSTVTASPSPTPSDIPSHSESPSPTDATGVTDAPSPSETPTSIATEPEEPVAVPFDGDCSAFITTADIQSINGRDTEATPYFAQDTLAALGGLGCTWDLYPHMPAVAILPLATPGFPGSVAAQCVLDRAWSCEASGTSATAQVWTELQFPSETEESAARSMTDSLVALAIDRSSRLSVLRAPTPPVGSWTTAVDCAAIAKGLRAIDPGAKSRPLESASGLARQVAGKSDFGRCAITLPNTPSWSELAFTVYPGGARIGVEADVARSDVRETEIDGFDTVMNYSGLYGSGTVIDLFRDNNRLSVVAGPDGIRGAERLLVAVADRLDALAD